MSNGPQPIPDATSTQVRPLLAEAELVALREPLRRYVISRIGDSHRVDDIVQETLTRMIQVVDRLEVRTLTAYAMTVARHQIASTARLDQTERRNLPRLVDLVEPARPDERVTAGESRRALEGETAYEQMPLRPSGDFRGRPPTAGSAAFGWQASSPPVAVPGYDEAARQGLPASAQPGRFTGTVG